VETLSSDASSDDFYQTQASLLYYRAVLCAALAARVVAVRISSGRTNVHDRSALDAAARWVNCNPNCNR
jgi:hypothetical protein